LRYQVANAYNLSGSAWHSVKMDYAEDLAPFDLLCELIPRCGGGEKVRF